MKRELKDRTKQELIYIVQDLEKENSSIQSLLNRTMFMIMTLGIGYIIIMIRAI